MKQNVTCTNVNVAAAQRLGGTILCCPDVRFASVGTPLLDGAEKQSLKWSLCSGFYTCCLRPDSEFGADRYTKTKEVL